jgi:hypothetical protein
MNKEYTEQEIKNFIKEAKTDKEIEALEFAIKSLQNNEKHNSDFYTAWIEGDFENKHIENIWICFDRQIEIRIHIDEDQQWIYFIIYYHEGNKEGIIGLNKTEIFDAISDIQKEGLNYSFDVIQ